MNKATKKPEAKPEEKPLINFQKKLSTVKIYGKVTARSVDPGETLDLYEVVGIASGTKTGSTDHGDWTALTGNFAAQNLSTGEQFRSGVCFLPDVALDPTVGQLDAGAASVQFGWIIGIKGDDSVQCGYTYYARPLIEPSEDDPLEILRGSMSMLKIEHKS